MAVGANGLKNCRSIPVLGLNLTCGTNQAKERGNGQRYTVLHKTDHHPPVDRWNLLFRNKAKYITLPSLKIEQRIPDCSIAQAPGRMGIVF
jgi:hypothetical protein